MSYAEKIESLIAERDNLSAELAGAIKSRDAAMLMYESARQSRDDLLIKQREWQDALATLDSERAANALLTAQLAAAEARAERLSAALMLGHIWRGNCPEPSTPDDRDPECPACIALGAPK